MMKTKQHNIEIRFMRRNEKITNMGKQNGNPGGYRERKNDPVGHRLFQAQFRLHEVFCGMEPGRLQKVYRGGRGSDLYVTTVKTVNRHRGESVNEHKGKTRSSRITNKKTGGANLAPLGRKGDENKKGYNYTSN